MIIKSAGKKIFQSKKYSNVFEEKTMYLNEERNVFKGDLSYINMELQDYVGFHNLGIFSNDVKEIEKEFLKNYEKFHSKDPNKNILYHDKISFHPEDRNYFLNTPQIALDIAQKWLEIRAPECLGYYKMHWDKEHIHVHVIYSANLLASSQQCRISRIQFKSYQWELESYKRQKYPFLKQKEFYQNGYRSSKKTKSSEQEQTRRQKKEGMPQISKTERVNQTLNTN